MERTLNMPVGFHQGIEWIENAPLGHLNSMGLPARARLLANVQNEAGLTGFFEWACQQAEPFVILGGGTNVVFADDYLDRVVLCLGGEFATFRVTDAGITSGAAVPLGRLVEAACEAGLSGLEGAWGIPGSLGGALRGNAGAFEWSMGDCVEWVDVFDRRGDRIRLAAGDIDFRYRKSNLAEWLIARARLALTRDEPAGIRERLERTRARRSRQPRGARSAGCIFKNPPGDKAARLIDAAGLKSTRRGGAMVSPQHANFIVNEANATGRDVLDLIEAVRRRVREQFGVELETEVQILGSTGP